MQIGKILAVAILFVTLSFAGNSLACQELTWSTKERAENSDEVYIGRVTSISIPELETRVLTKAQEGFLIRGAERVIRVKVYEKLKGNRENVIEVKLGWCGGGQADIGSLVALYLAGKGWHVKQSETDIADTRRALANR